MSFFTFAEDVVFINDDLRAGMNRAASEGKLVFLEFSASYCTPCKIMDEYTFTNPTVIDRMNKGYVPVKVNIQSFDGFDLKNQYKVTVLPTIIILDSKGRQVVRYEETMGATKLAGVLDKYDVPKNRTPQMLANTGYSPSTKVNNAAPVYKPVNYTPSVSAPVATRPSAPTAYNNISASRRTEVAAPNSTPSTPYNSTRRTESVAAPSYAYSAPYPSAPRRTETAATPTRTLVAPYTASAPRKTEVAAAMPVSNAAVVNGKRRDIPTGSFTIQAGAYSLAVAAQSAVDEMTDQIGNQKQYIMQSKTGGKTIFRIFVGSFTSRQQADTFLKKSGIQGFVRAFDEFKK